MRKKIIKVHITEEEFPHLFKIHRDYLGETCYDIFAKGYEYTYPKEHNDNSEILKSINRYTDGVMTKLDHLDYNGQIDKFTDMLEDFFGIMNNSSKKGKITENLIYNILKNRFKNFAIEETRSKPHHGDAIIHIPKKKEDIKIILEIKNYSKVVNSKEIKKLKYDMIHTGIRYSIFVSMKSGFVGRKDLSIEEFFNEGKIYTIIYVPNMTNDHNFIRLESGLLMMERLIDYHSKLTRNNIEIKKMSDSIMENLKLLDGLYIEYNKLKSQYYKMENSIKQQLNIFFNYLRSFEIDMKNRINSIWNSISIEFGNLENELIVSDSVDKEIVRISKRKGLIYKKLREIFELIKKNGLIIENIKARNWTILKLDGDKIGNIKTMSQKIEIELDNPKLNLTVTNKKDRTLEFLSNLLKVQ